MLLSSIFTSHETFQVKLLQTTILKSPVNTACFKQSKKTKTEEHHWHYCRECRLYTIHWKTVSCQRSQGILMEYLWVIINLPKLFSENLVIFRCGSQHPKVQWSYDTLNVTQSTFINITHSMLQCCNKLIFTAIQAIFTEQIKLITCSVHLKSNHRLYCISPVEAI